MILDRLYNADIYRKMHPGFAEAFDFLNRKDLKELSPGRHDIDGDRVFAVVVKDKGKGRNGTKLEIHKKYIDIQYEISGTDKIGWKPADECTNADSEFDENKDLGFFPDEPETWVSLPPNTFAVFFPQDAHAPMGAEGNLHKVIVKIVV